MPRRRNSGLERIQAFKNTACPMPSWQVRAEKITLSAGLRLLLTNREPRTFICVNKHQHECRVTILFSHSFARTGLHPGPPTSSRRFERRDRFRQTRLPNMPCCSSRPGCRSARKRKSGDIWVFRHRRQRPQDGKWVEATPSPSTVGLAFSRRAERR